MGQSSYQNQKSKTTQNLQNCISKSKNRNSDPPKFPSKTEKKKKEKKKKQSKLERNNDNRIALNNSIGREKTATASKHDNRIKKITIKDIRKYFSSLLL